MSFCFQSAAIHILTEVYKAGLKQTCRWKREDILTAFSDNCGHSSMIQHQILISSFLKVSYNLEPKTKSMNFYSVTLKLFGLSSTLNDFCNIMHWSPGKYWFNEICRSSTCWHISIYNIKKSHAHQKNHQSHQKSL